ncbi:MAG: hypothetical protein AAF988_01925 [Pseudomonadota bacterium]
MVFPKKNNQTEDTQGVKKERLMPRPGVADYIAGEAGSFVSNLSPYLPQDLIGGAVPHVAGAEDEIVWNAASQACGTEKVHYTYTVEDGKVWYLACPSSSLASNPDSWCPLSAALPGNSEYWDRETVYLYEQEGLASALRWDQDTGRMQVYLGAARTLLPKIQSMDANFVTVNPEVADITPWKNKMLNTEKLSRATAKTLLLTGILLALVIFVFLVFQYLLTNFVQRDLAKVEQETQRTSQQLMMKAFDALQSDTIKHMVRVQELLDELKKIDGTLVKYKVDGSKVTWEALVPQGLEKSGAMRGTTVLGLEEGDKRIRVQGTR